MSLTEQEKLNEDCCWSSLRSNCIGTGCKCTCHAKERSGIMKYKGVARLYLNGGQIIEQECDGVKVALAGDGRIYSIDYVGNLREEDLVVKFLQRTEITAVTFVKNLES